MDANLFTGQPVSDRHVHHISLAPEQIYQGDPLLTLLKTKWHLNNIHILLVELVLTLGCFLGLYLLPGLQAGLVNNLLFVLLEVVTGLIFYSIYLWLPDFISSLFNVLDQNNVLDKARGRGGIAYEDFLKDMLTWMKKIGWVIGTLVFILSYLLYRSLSAGPPFLAGVPVWLQIVTALLDGYIAYQAIISGIRLLIALFFTNWLFHVFPIKVNPLHPDGAGGLGAMRSIVWVSVGMVFGNTLTFLGTILLVNAYGGAPPIVDSVAGAAGYMILVFTIVLAWLAFPHYLMVKARNAVLQPLADEFLRVAEQEAELKHKKTSDVQADADRLAAIKSRYELLRDTYPVWPLEIIQIRRVIAATSISAIIPLFPYLSSVFAIVKNYLATGRF